MTRVQQTLSNNVFSRKKNKCTSEQKSEKLRQTDKGLERNYDFFLYKTGKWPIKQK